VLGHELGHSVLGYRDPVSGAHVNVVALSQFQKLSRASQLDQLKRIPLGMGDNVRYVENPLRLEFGIPIRDSYLDRATYQPYYDSLKVR